MYNLHLWKEILEKKICFFFFFFEFPFIKWTSYILDSYLWVKSICLRIIRIQKEHV